MRITMRVLRVARAHRRFARFVGVALAVTVVACSEAHECAGTSCDAAAASSMDGGCAPGEWRACALLCVFEVCTAAGIWSGACVEHGGPCDVGPRVDGATVEAGVAPIDAGAGAGSDGAPELDGGIVDAGHRCGVWTCTSAQRCIQTCYGRDVALASDFQCVDVPPECAPSDCTCIAAHDSCVFCAAPSFPCDRCTVSGP